MWIYTWKSPTSTSSFICKQTTIHRTPEGVWLHCCCFVGVTTYPCAPSFPIQRAMYSLVASRLCEPNSPEQAGPPAAQKLTSIRTPSLFPLQWSLHPGAPCTFTPWLARKEVWRTARLSCTRMSPCDGTTQRWSTWTGASKTVLEEPGVYSAERRFLPWAARVMPQCPPLPYPSPTQKHTHTSPQRRKIFVCDCVCVCVCVCVWCLMSHLEIEPSRNRISKSVKQ